MAWDMIPSPLDLRGHLLLVRPGDDLSDPITRYYISKPSRARLQISSPLDPLLSPPRSQFSLFLLLRDPHLSPSRTPIHILSSTVPTKTLIFTTQHLPHFIT